MQAHPLLPGPWVAVHTCQAPLLMLAALEAASTHAGGRDQAGIKGQPGRQAAAADEGGSTAAAQTSIRAAPAAADGGPRGACADGAAGGARGAAATAGSAAMPEPEGSAVAVVEPLGGLSSGAGSPDDAWRQLQGALALRPPADERALLYLRLWYNLTCARLLAR